MHTKQTVNTAWELFNLLEKLSNLLFDQYHEQFMDRHLEEEWERLYYQQCEDDIKNLTSDP